MSRPLKGGVDYFPLDVVLDTKFDLIEAEFGIIGFAVIVKLFQRIYGVQGYYCEWTDEVALLFGKSIGLGGNAVSEIVSASIKRGIFDREMFEKYQILTSAGIQKRYLEAVKRRKQFKIKKEYLLVKVAQIQNSAAETGVIVDINSVNEYHNAQSKGKESKGDHIIADAQKALDFYQQNIGVVSPMILGEVKGYLEDGLQADLIIESLRISISNNVRRWSYAKAILNGCRDKNIFTLPEFLAEKNAEKKPEKEKVKYLD